MLSTFYFELNNATLCYIENSKVVPESRKNCNVTTSFYFNFIPLILVIFLQ